MQILSKENVRFASPLVALAGSVRFLLSPVDPPGRMAFLNNHRVPLGHNFELSVLFVSFTLHAGSLFLLPVEHLERLVNRGLLHQIQNNQPLGELGCDSCLRSPWLHACDLSHQQADHQRTPNLCELLLR